MAWTMSRYPHTTNGPQISTFAELTLGRYHRVSEAFGEAPCGTGLPDPGLAGPAVFEA